MELRETIIESRIHVVKAIGEMDMYNSHELKTLVAHHFASRGGPLILDLGELRYIDSSGVGVLIFTFTQSRSQGIPVFYTNVHGTVRRVIELTSLLNFFPIVDTLEDAVQKARRALP